MLNDKGCLQKQRGELKDYFPTFIHSKPQTNIQLKGPEVSTEFFLFHMEKLIGQLMCAF